MASLSPLLKVPFKTILVPLVSFLTTILFVAVVVIFIDSILIGYFLYFNLGITPLVDFESLYKNGS